MHFTEEHEWVCEAEGNFKVGISDYAQSELGEVVFVELPDVGSSVKKGDSILTVESVKAVSNVYAPIDGEVVAVNEALEGSPELVNEAPEADGWMIVLKAENSGQLEDLMNQEAYKKFVDEVSK